MKRVVLESPYAAPTEAGVAENVAYAKRAAMDCLKRGEAPIASHLLWPQEGLLREAEPAERALGIQAGFAWMPSAELVVLYVDRGISGGMANARLFAQKIGIPVEERRLDG